MDTFSNEEGRVVHPLFRTQIKDNTKPTTAVPISVATPSQSDDTLASDLPKPKMDIDNHSKNSKKKIKKKNIKPGDEMKKKKKKKSSDEKRHKSKSEKKKKKKEPKSKIKSEEEKEDGNEKGIDTKQIFRENIRKLKTLIVLKKLFGIETEKLVEGEKKSDMQYRKRTSDIMAICMAQSNYDKLIHDWDTPLFHSPLSMEEIKALSVKSAFHTKSESRSHNQLHLPTDLEKLCEVTFITGYELSLKAQCFYNDTDIERFRVDKYFEEHPDEFEVIDSDSYEDPSSSDDISYEEEIIHDSDVSESSYFEEEIIEEEIIEEQVLPLKRVSV